MADFSCRGKPGRNINQAGMKTAIFSVFTKPSTLESMGIFSQSNICRLNGNDIAFLKGVGGCNNIKIGRPDAAGGYLIPQADQNRGFHDVFSYNREAACRLSIGEYPGFSRFFTIPCPYFLKSAGMKCSRFTIFPGVTAQEKGPRLWKIPDIFSRPHQYGKRLPASAGENKDHSRWSD